MVIWSSRPSKMETNSVSKSFKPGSRSQKLSSQEQPPPKSYKSSRPAKMWATWSVSLETVWMTLPPSSKEISVFPWVSLVLKSQRTQQTWFFSTTISHPSLTVSRKAERSSITSRRPSYTCLLLIWLKSGPSLPWSSCKSHFLFPTSSCWSSASELTSILPLPLPMRRLSSISWPESLENKQTTWSPRDYSLTPMDKWVRSQLLEDSSPISS